MTLNGHVLNGNIVLDEPRDLPEGAVVRVEIVSGEMCAPQQGRDDSPTLLERLEPVVGSVKGLPPDLSVNHDHYLYGVPKK